MQEIKKWNLFKEPFTENDYIWITGLGCELTIKNPELVSVELYSGTLRFPAAAPWIEVETIGNKQESMLKLKYGDSLYLVEFRIDYD